MARTWFRELGYWLFIALGVLVISAVRGPLIERYSVRSPKEEVSLLLTPEYTVLLSLGHREALADYLFGTALVKYGISFQDKAPFTAAYRYLDTITTLAPKYPRPYLYADALLTLLPRNPEPTDYVNARRIQERGMQALPYHTELWSVAGQFAAYLAAPHLPKEQSQEFKLAGARALTRACELASNNAAIPYHCLTAAALLNKAGHREAMIEMVSRTLAVNDDPEIRQRALAYLQYATSERDKEIQERRLERFAKRWKSDLPQVSRAMISLLGPAPDVWECAGPEAAGRPGCETTWLEFAASSPEGQALGAQ